MISKIPLRPAGVVERWLHAASVWQRLLAAATLMVALLLSAALLYWQPGSSTFSPAPPSSVADSQPALPPGFDTYYYWGQHQPISQQP